MFSFISYIDLENDKFHTFKDEVGTLENSGT